MHFNVLSEPVKAFRKNVKMRTNITQVDTAVNDRAMRSKKVVENAYGFLGFSSQRTLTITQRPLNFATCR